MVVRAPIASLMIIPQEQSADLGFPERKGVLIPHYIATVVGGLGAG